MQNGTIKNIGVDGYINAECNIGGVVGKNSRTIENCYNKATIIHSDLAFVGGVVGVNYGTVGNCYNEGTIIGPCIGGVVGMQSGTNFNIKNCYNLGNLIISQQMGGGIVCAGTGGGYLGNCYNVGNITLASSEIRYGQIIGIQFPTHTVANVYSNSLVGNSNEGATVITNADFASTLNENPDGKMDLDGDGIPETPIWKADSENINNGYPILYWQ